MLSFDLNIIRQCGGNLCGDDRFVIVACRRCGTQYLYNQEVRDIYYDPFDLSKRFFNIQAIGLPPCTGCGELDWKFSEHQPVKAEVQLGPWGRLLQANAEE